MILPPVKQYIWHWHTILVTINTGRGFVALVTILIVSAISLSAGIGMMVRATDDGIVVLGENEVGKARNYAELCAEIALMNLERIFQYNGNETIVVPDGSCTILPVEGVGNVNRVIKTYSSSSGRTSKIRIDVLRISPQMQIASWNEVSDF
jgi:hypothetical protein